MKPIQFTCLLRMSKSQMIENGFKDTSIDTFYGLLLEYLASQSHSISFPDSVLSCITQVCGIILYIFYFIIDYVILSLVETVLEKMFCCKLY